MPEITAKMVMDLRGKTGAAMMLCKEALTATDGDFEAATVYIRKKLGNKLTGASDRTASEGVIAVVVLDRQDAAIVELNAETDFVARNDEFKALAKEIAAHVAKTKGHDVETVLTQDSLAQPGMTVQSRIEDVYSRLREKIVFRRFEFISTDANGVLAGYVHVPANDKIGVLVELEAASVEAAQGEGAQTAGRELAMQIAASRPRYQSREDVPANILEQEKDIARETARNEGRPEAALEKIVEGRTRKFYEEAVLLDQVWLRDPKKTVASVLKEAGVTLRRYVRYSVGEEIGAATSGAIKETAE
ncbi:MAG TPA: translation elongation factor Ts [Chthonomonadaceae bacterium]|nr:translation elongation factor Ts [Chthonomonadaceae bacterium]